MAKVTKGDVVKCLIKQALKSVEKAYALVEYDERIEADPLCLSLQVSREHLHDAINRCMFLEDDDDAST